jgi:hypothetical protein
MDDLEVKPSDLEGVIVSTQTSSEQYSAPACEPSTTSDHYQECAGNSAFPAPVFLE